LRFKFNVANSVVYYWLKTPKYPENRIKFYIRTSKMKKINASIVMGQPAGAANSNNNV